MKALQNLRNVLLPTQGQSPGSNATAQDAKRPKTTPESPAPLLQQTTNGAQAASPKASTPCQRSQMRNPIEKPVTT
ncbi:unnamed protein product [Gongylonema pulchrum]|uniref:Uncharacterized protein n=1 Tax=Gongylonema pulchrum TaxID=637853 RepID=A0A183DM17_9BILA|nr:unnamed protein product [Gongylonema pulchrum]